MSATLDAAALRDLLLEVSKRVVAAEAMLCEADRHIGDGDHGLGMARGFAAAGDRLREDELDDVADVLRAVGDALLRTMGGASGVVFGLLFRPAPGVDLAAPTVTLGRLAAHFDGARHEIERRGGAKVGDKTMLDALAPAVEALRASAAQDASLGDALRAAARAAQDGVEATRALTARRGKAMTLGERSLGHPDPGALSTALIFQTMADRAVGSAAQPPATTVAGSTKEEQS